MKKLVFRMAQNDENQFLKWTLKQFFLGICNNSKAIEIKKTLGHFFEGICSFISGILVMLLQFYAM